MSSSRLPPLALSCRARRAVLLLAPSARHASSVWRAAALLLLQRAAAGVGPPPALARLVCVCASPPLRVILPARWPLADAIRSSRRWEARQARVASTAEQSSRCGAESSIAQLLSRAAEHESDRGTATRRVEQAAKGEHTATGDHASEGQRGVQQEQQQGVWRSRGLCAFPVAALWGR